MYEHHRAPLANRETFARRLVASACFSLALLTLSLFIGMVGYHFFEQLSWLDSYVCASMILTGMGPTAPLTSPAGKIFAGLYAIFSGIVFLGSIGVAVTPIFHRFMHKLHLDEDK